MAHDVRITISSPPDRQYIVAEIFFGNEQWAEINKEVGSLQVEFYPRQNGEPWSLSFQQAVEALNKAKEKLDQG